jgi:hypothetical protein
MRITDRQFFVVYLNNAYAYSLKISDFIPKTIVK